MSAKETVQVELPPVLDREAALKLTEIFRESRGRRLILDASQVTRLGTPCVQVLLSAAQTWREDLVSIRIVEASRPFREGLALLGLSVQALERGLVP